MLQGYRPRQAAVAAERTNSKSLSDVNLSVYCGVSSRILKLFGPGHGITFKHDWVLGIPATPGTRRSAMNPKKTVTENMDTALTELFRKRPDLVRHGDVVKLDPHELFAVEGVLWRAKLEAMADLKVQVSGE
jgi:hypothetical protein